MACAVLDDDIACPELLLRAARKFAEADTIRDELAAAGIVVEDTAGGVRWHRETTPAG